MQTARNERVGAMIPTSTPPEEIPTAAEFIEESGFGEVWLAEDYFLYGGMTATAATLQATSDIKVGLGVVASVVRHPAVTAMELATLGRAYPDRVLPGIGHGVPFWTKQMGLYPSSPLSVFKEVVTSVRRLVEGETLSETDGQFHFDQVALAHPCPGLPLLGGVVGPKSLELSGELTEGTVLSVLSGPKYVEFAAEHTATGQAKAGKEGRHLLPTLALFAVDEDGDAARASAREIIAFYLAAVGPTPLTGVYDANDRLVELLEGGGAEAIARDMPDEWLEELAVVGTPEECATKIDRLLNAGASSVVLFPTRSDQGRDYLTTAAKSVLPKVSG